jgi:hypothetical protein
MLVWYCAELAYPGRTFRQYAVLGDDVVIADPLVAKRYEEALGLRLRGLVRSQSCLVRRNWTKKRECSTGTTANKDRNYIDNCSSPSPSLRLVGVWRLERKTTSPSRRWCQ